MKSFIIIITFGLNAAAFAQKNEKIISDTATLRIYYVLTKKESTSEKAYRTDTMLLDIGKYVSRFYDPARLKRDSAIAYLFGENNQSAIKEMHVLKDEDAGAMAKMPGTISSNTREGESYQIVKDKIGNITVFDYGNTVLTKLQYEDNIGKFNWQLEESMDTIATYSCQKATLNFRGRKYIAWFTADIPTSEGPWKFSGLPGLIVKVEDSDQLFSFTMIGLIQPKDPLPFKISKKDYLKVSRDDWNQSVQKRGLGMNANFTSGIMTIGSAPGKYTPVLMELE